MSKHLGPWLVAIISVACGGTSGGDEETGGSSNGGSSSAGSSQGGSNSAGKGGSAGTGGANNGGSISTGGIGTAGTAGTISQGGFNGGPDERCPAKKPSAECSAEQAGVVCQYDFGTGCLCLSGGTNAFSCILVDPSCPTLGTAGTGGESAVPPPAGAGGYSAKIALPPRQQCTCSAGNWLCHFGI